MSQTTLILFFDNDRVWLTDHRWLPLSALKLPAHITAIDGTAWWKVMVINFDYNTNHAFAEVLSYNTGQQPIPDSEYPNDDWCETIETISFKTLKTFELLRTLPARHQPADGTGYLANQPMETAIDVTADTAQEADGTAMLAQNEENHCHTTAEEAPVTGPPPSFYLPHPLPVRVYNETFSVGVKHLRFKLGCVAFDYNLKPAGIRTEITISNHDLREEFDAIKNYFSNVLRSNRINVTARFEVQGQRILRCEATSPEISRINRQMIDSVKFEFVGDVPRRRLKIDIDRNLFTSDELFEALTEGRSNGRAFYDNDQTMMNDLLKITDTKHYRNLRYLSDRHLHTVMRLRFILRPFSFIFLLDGERHYHLVWETLDTEEATYVWHIPRDREKARLMLRKIEEIINVVKIQGKTAYISSADDQYRRIYHDYSELVDGFLKWKVELESVLT